MTLHQPWASLVAIGVKTIETRSWATSYRGPLAIHAAKRPPGRAERFVGHYMIRGFGTYGNALVGPGLPEFRSVPRLEGYILPFGAVVATCTLSDVVPIVNDGTARDCVDTRGDGRAALRLGNPETITDVTGEVAYGDYRPGRYAWILDNIVPLAEPVPTRGAQRLWEWDPEKNV